MLGCRDMVKQEQLEELFEATASDWRTFRAWLSRTNPNELAWIDTWADTWHK